jgi:DNA polymerase sigma
VLSYTDIPSGLKCKVCVGNRQTVRGTSFFNSPMIPLSARFPAFKPLMLPLKCVFTQRGLEKAFAGGLGTFRVGMMLLNYLVGRGGLVPVWTSLHQSSLNMCWWPHVLAVTWYICWRLHVLAMFIGTL